VISATHRDLAAQDQFREDLYYRLCDVVLDVPPLRERDEDLSLLVEHFRRAFNKRYGLGVEGVEEAGLARLSAHAWPGNVRELEKVLKEAMILRGIGRLSRDDVDGVLERRRPRSLEARAGGRQEAGVRRPPLGERALTALRLARERDSVSRHDLAVACAISGEAARQELVVLLRLGYLVRRGHGRGARYVVA
jgi:DNA-binding NtrC family response regulator